MAADARFALRAMTATVRVLKKRFNNLTGEEVVALAGAIVEAIIEATN